MENVHQMFEEMGDWKSDFQSKSFSKRILIVDDEPAIAEEMSRYLRQEGYAVDLAYSSEVALQAFILKTYHLVLIDVFLPGKSTMELIQLLRETCAQCVVVLLIGPAPLQVPPDILELSMIPCLSKPITPYVLRKRIHDLLYRKEKPPASRLFSLDRSQGVSFEGIRTRSQKMRELFDKVRLLAQTEATILITGELGTGKNILARAIHNQSKRQKGPFLSMKTAMMARDKMLFELFGSDERGNHTDGPFRGKLGMAIGGSAFLDDFSQLDEKSVHRFQRMLEPSVDSIQTFRSFRGLDIRMIFATQKHLADLPSSKSFHAECLEKLKPLRIHIPPLRERPEDITPLAYEFLSFFSIQHRKLIGIIPTETRKLLERYYWPGNVKELRQVIEQAVFLAKSSVLEPDLLPYHIYHAASGGKVISIPLGWSLEKAEKEIIWRTLEAHHKNKKGTAEVLGISRRSLYNKLALYFDDYEQENEPPPALPPINKIKHR